MDETSVRQSLCEAGRALWDRGLVGATEGNLSVRLDPDRILCTPTGVCKGALRDEDIVAIDSRGNPLGAGLPSSEIKLHLRIYERLPECRAIVHAHPIVATGFAVAEVSIPFGLIPEADAVLGEVALTPAAKPGTNEVPDSVEPYLVGRKALLLGRHGAVTLGATIDEALLRMETLERIARIVAASHLVAGDANSKALFERISRARSTDGLF